MTSPVHERLKFLVRVVGKEVNHLIFAQKQVFLPFFTLDPTFPPLSMIFTIFILMNHIST